MISAIAVLNSEESAVCIIVMQLIIAEKASL